MILELASQQAADKCVLDNKGLYIDGQTVHVAKALTRIKRYVTYDQLAMAEKGENAMFYLLSHKCIKVNNWSSYTWPIIS